MTREKAESRDKETFQIHLDVPQSCKMLGKLLGLGSGWIWSGYMELSVPTPTEIIINCSSKIYLERCLETPFDNTVMVFFILFFTILKKEFYFIFFLFSFLCAEPLLLQGLFSSCGDWGLLWLCSGFSLRWLLLLQSTGARARGLSSWVSGLESTGPAVVGRGLSCCSACGIF